jgi:hypothetical protein
LCENIKVDNCEWLILNSSGVEPFPREKRKLSGKLSKDCVLLIAFVVGIGSLC